MYGDSIASTSTQSYKDACEASQRPRSAPVYNDGTGSLSAPRRREDATSLLQAIPSYHAPSNGQYLGSNERYKEIALGVLEDRTSAGSIVLTGEYPDVGECLAYIRAVNKLPDVLSTLNPVLSDAIVALAAQAVFPHPTDPAHWFFWDVPKREGSAAVIRRAVEHNPPSILSYAGSTEIDLFTLRLQYHHRNWHRVIKHKSWYSQLVSAEPKAAKHASKAHHLRSAKRKADNLNAPSLEEEGAENTKEPAPKRAKLTRSCSSPKQAASATNSAPHATTETPSVDSTSAGDLLTVPFIRTRRSASRTQTPVLSIRDPSPANSNASRRSARHQTRKTVQSAVEAPPPMSRTLSAESASSSLSSASSGPIALPAPPSIPTSRAARSSSRLSSVTLVDTDTSRDHSPSATTVVDPTDTGGKEAKREALESKIAVDVIGNDSTDTQEPEPSIIMTRAQYRAASGTSAPPARSGKGRVPYPTEKAEQISAGRRGTRASAGRRKGRQ